MVRFKSLRVQNFRSIPTMDLAIKPGVSVVIGKNGSGKSSLIKALYFGLTGDMLDGETKKEALRHGETKGLVELDMEAAGETWTIHRSLSGNTVKFGTTASMQTLTRAEADARLQDLLGVKFDLLDKSNFVAQEALDEFFKFTPSARLAWFNGLFGADFEKWREQLQEVCDQYPEIQVVTKDWDLEIANLHKEMDTIPNVDLNLDRNQLEKRMQEVAASLALRSKEDVAVDVAAVTKLITENKGLKTRLEQELTKLGEVSDEEASMVPLVSKIKAIEDELERELARAPVKQEPELPLLLKGASSPADEILRIARAQIHKMKDELHLYEHGKCPTCDRPFEGGSEKVEGLRKHLEGAQKNLAELEKYTADKAKWDRLNDYYARSEANIAEQRDKLGLDDEAYVDLLTRIGKVAENAKLKGEIVKNLKKVETTLAAQTAELNALKLEGNVTSAEKLVLFNENKVLQESLYRHGEAVAKRRGLITAIETAKVEKTTVEKMSGEASKRVRVRSTLNSARAVLHRDRLPKLYTSEKVKDLNRLIRTHLDSFQVPFNLHITPDMEVMSRFPGGVERPVKQLSGGQKKVAAMALRLAIGGLLARRVLFMALDEPTAYLDPANVEGVAEVLTKVNAEAIGRGMTIWVATHEDRLLRSAQDLIRMSP